MATLRQQLGTAGARLALELWTDGGLRLIGTRVEGLGVVACSDAVAAAEATVFRTGAGQRYEVVARADEHHLVLLRPVGAGTPPLAARAGRGTSEPPPVGTFVAVLHPEGAVAAGVLSAPPRPIPANLEEVLLGPYRRTVERIVRGVLKAAELFGSEEVAELARQILRVIDLRSGFGGRHQSRPACARTVLRRTDRSGGSRCAAGQLAG
ncbi:MAG: hypothetical protein KatS3mg102_2347 [Planctomycetota bacterium]|nr:MAG: hypothetical protein KatS3mg102_2347 [Planctomycetota bacterium]